MTRHDGQNLESFGCWRLEQRTKGLNEMPLMGYGTEKEFLILTFTNKSSKAYLSGNCLPPRTGSGREVKAVDKYMGVNIWMRIDTTVVNECVQGESEKFYNGLLRYTNI